MERRHRTAADRWRPLIRLANRIEALQVRFLGVSGVSLVRRRDVLLLETTGRRSGRRRRVCLSYLPDSGHHSRGDAYLVGGGAGGMTKVDWVANLRVHPEATVWVRRRRTAVIAEEVTGEEEQQVRRTAFERWPDAPKYERASGRKIPYFRLIPVVRAE